MAKSFKLEKFQNTEIVVTDGNSWILDIEGHSSS